MRNVVLRPEAEADIEDIAAYTIEQWGIDQARTYVTEVRNTIEGLVETALHHPIQDAIVPDLRKVRCDHHVIFYFVRAETIEVVRVLHARMDFEGRLA